MQDARAMLDSLMGNDRNSAKTDGKRASWRDDDVCKNYLTWECPCDFFLTENGKAAPRSPLGECPFQHSEAMKIRFKADKDYKRARFRYLQDLELQMRRRLDALNKKIEGDKDKLEAQCKLAAAEPPKPPPPKPDDDDKEALKAWRREMEEEKYPDEVCDVCGTYTSFKGAVVMRHDAGILHVGWGRLRESFARLQQEVQAIRDAPPEAREGDAREEDDDKSRAKEHKRARGDDQKRDASREKDRRREHDREKDRGREKGRDREDRDRDRHDDRHRDRGRDRDRDRAQGRRHEKRDKSPKKEKEFLDEFGRDTRIATKVREVKDTRRDKDDGRSRSRQSGRSAASGDQDNDDKANEEKEKEKERERELERQKEKEREEEEAKKKALEDVKIIEIEFSEHWEQEMGQRFKAAGLKRSAWTMEGFDRDGRPFSLDSGEVELSIESFPIQFKFTRKKA